MSATATPIEPRHEVDDSTSVPPGYKQSEIGVIPNDWEVAEIGDSNPFVTSGSRGWAPFYSDIGSAFLRITNISRESIYPNLNDLKFVNIPPGVSEGVRTHLEDGDVLISITADIGIIGYVNARVAKPAYINQHIALVRFDPDRIDGQFVSYFLASGVSRKLFRGLTDQGAKAGMSLLTVRRIRFARPPASEQHAIAAALADVDELIGVLEKLIAKKRAIKQGAMQQLLTGETRLPGFETEWESRTLGELCWSITDGTHFTPHYVDDGVPFYSVENVTADNFTNTKFISAREHKMLIKRCKPEKGDILLTRIGALGDTKFVDWNIDASIYVSLALLKVKDDVDARYLYCYTKSKKFVEDLEARSLMNASPKKINMGDIGSVPVPVPELEEQHAIAAVLSDMDAEIAALERRREKTKSIKLGMMQSLLTGRVRLAKPKSKA